MSPSESRPQPQLLLGALRVLFLGDVCGSRGGGGGAGTRRVLPALDGIRREAQIVFGDMHAKATAEKQAMGWFLDGRVSGVFGSHTHVQTADEAILDGGTAYINDSGMCGSFDSVLGMNKDQSLRRMIEMVPVRLRPAADDVRINGVWVDVEPASGRALAIGRPAQSVAFVRNQAPAG